MLDWWWAYLALGGFVGLIAGLLGIGGGAAMVPVLAFIFAAKGFDAALVVHLALGTSMATILFTSVSSVLAHHRHGAVNWATVKRMSPGIVLGTFAGALLAGILGVRVLTVVFMLLVLWSSSQMLSGKPPASANKAPPALLGTNLVTAAIGIISSLTATGGGSLVVVFLVRYGTRIQEAIATAAAIGWPLAAAGTAGYVITGWGLPLLPPFSLGYVYLPALAGIVIASMVSAPLGARLAHRMPGALLKKIFALLLFTLATKMLISFL